MKDKMYFVKYMIKNKEYGTSLFGNNITDIKEYIACWTNWDKVNYLVQINEDLISQICKEMNCKFKNVEFLEYNFSGGITEKESYIKIKGKIYSIKHSSDFLFSIKDIKED